MFAFIDTKYHGHVQHCPSRRPLYEICLRLWTQLLLRFYPDKSVVVQLTCRGYVPNFLDEAVRVHVADC